LFHLSDLAEVVKHITRCPHSYAAEILLKSSGEEKDIVAHLPHTCNLSITGFGSPADPFLEVDTPLPTDPLVLSVCFDSTVCGRKMFVADSRKIFSCMVCR
jgi:hypothetical protein